MASKSRDSMQVLDTQYQKIQGAFKISFLKASPKDFSFKLQNFSCPIQKAKDCWNHTGISFFVWCSGLWVESLTRKRSYPNFAWHQIITDLLKCWVGHKVGSRGAAQPRKVGQPKPSISSAAQLQSKKERKRKREREREAGKTGTGKATRGRKRNQRPMFPFCLLIKMKINTH